MDDGHLAGVFLSVGIAGGCGIVLDSPNLAKKVEDLFSGSLN